MSSFSDFFNGRNLPPSLDQDIQLLTQKIRVAIHFDVGDIETIFEGVDDIGGFDPMQDEILEGAFENIVDGIIETYVCHDRAFAEAIQDAYSVPIKDLLRNYNESLVQVGNFSEEGRTRVLSYELLEERLMDLLDEAASRIALGMVVLTDSYEQGWYHVDEIEDEPLLVREKLSFDDFMMPARLSQDDKYHHQHMVSLFHSYLIIDPDEVVEFLYDENYVDDMFRSIFDPSNLPDTLQGMNRDDLNSIKYCGIFCVDAIRSFYKEKHEKLTGYLSVEEMEDAPGMSEWSRAITYSLQEAAAQMTQAHETAGQIPCHPKFPLP